MKTEVDRDKGSRRENGNRGRRRSILEFKKRGKKSLEVIFTIYEAFTL